MRCTSSMSQFIQSLIASCQVSLGEPPCDFEVIGFGSIARQEMTPYSDLEFGILLGDHKAADVAYFEALTRAVQLKIVALGETVLPSMAISMLDGFYDVMTPKGFSVDGLMAHAIKWPLGNQHIPNLRQDQYFQLIDSPAGLVQLQTKQNVDPELHLASSVRSCTLLYQHYRTSSLENASSLTDTYLTLVGQTRETVLPTVLIALQEDLTKHNVHITNPSMEGMLYDVKRDLYRATNLLISSISYLYADNWLSSSLLQQVEGLQLEELAQHVYCSDHCERT